MMSRAAVLRKTAARCARCVPQMPLDAVADTVGVDVHRLARYLRSRPRRGRCADIAATVSEHKKFGQAAIAHPAAPPWMARSAWWTLDADLRHAAGSAAAGTADWAARTRLRGLKRGMGETERLPRTAIVRVAAASDAAEMIYDRTELALNESCPPALLAALSDTNEVMVRNAVAYNSAGLPRIDDVGRDSQYAAASNPRWPPGVVASFAGSEVWQIRRAAASHPAAAAGTLRCLGRDSTILVRVAAAANPNCPPSALRDLIADPQSEVRAAAAVNPRTPVASLEALAADQHPQVRAAAASNSATSAQRFVDDESHMVREAAAHRAGLSDEDLMRLAGDAHGSVSEAAAENPDSGIRVLKRCATSPYMATRAAAAENPNLPVDLLRRLCADFTGEVKAAAAANPRLDPRLLAKLALDSEPVVREAAVAAIRQRRWATGR